MQARERESQRFVPTIHTIERLYSVARGPLHQVIQGRDYDDAPLLYIKLKTDITEVAARQNLRLGIAIDAVALFDEADERLTLIGVAIDAPQGTLIDVFVDKHMRRHQATTHHLDCGRRDRDGLLYITAAQLPQLLNELGCMTVAGRLKGTDGAAAVRMVAPCSGCGPGRRGTKLTFEDQRDRAIDDPGAVERRQSQNSGRRHAAGPADQRGLGQFFAVQLGQAVDGLGQQLRRFMCMPIPALVQRGGAQPEIARQIDNARCQATVALNRLRRSSMRQAQKQQIARFQVIWMTVTQGCKLAQIGMRAMDKMSSAAPRGHLHNLDLRMEQEQADQLATCIAGATDNPNA